LARKQRDTKELVFFAIFRFLPSFLFHLNHSKAEETGKFLVISRLNVFKEKYTFKMKEKLIISEVALSHSKASAEL